MTLPSQLAGAMGLASWRAHLSMTDYESASAVGKTLTGGRKSPPKFKAVVATGLNEVGVTDSVMAALWGSGPFESAADTTGPAEKHHLGADMAIIDKSANRLLLYQAKIGSLISSTDLELKSKVTTSQVALMKKSAVTVDGIKYAVTGRLAIYQTDYRPHMHSYPGIPWVHGLLWSWAAKPSKALKYYREVLSAYSYSPCGVLAATVPSGISHIERVAARDTWPWEFDAYQWACGARSYLDLSETRKASRGGPRGPDWRDVRDEDHEPIVGLEPGDPEFAFRLREALGVPTSRQLHVLVF